VATALAARSGRAHPAGSQTGEPKRGHPRGAGRALRVLGGFVLAAALAGCGVVRIVTSPAAPGPVDVRPKGPVVASGVVNGVAWTMHAWVDGEMTCTSFDVPSGGWSGCGNGSIGPHDIDISRQNGDRLISLTGLVGTEIVALRVHFGDGSVKEYPTLPSPVAGTWVSGVVVPLAPVPVSIDGLDANGDIVATTEL
jgi:hypothetical protein